MKRYVKYIFIRVTTNSFYRYLGFLFSLMVSCSGVDNKIDNTTHLHKIKFEEAKNFLKFYIHHELKKDSIILLDAPYIFDSPDCLIQGVQKIGISKFNSIDSLVKSQNSKNIWTKSLIAETKLITKSEIPKTINHQNKGWENFRKTIGKDFYILSYPIFSKDMKFLLFYSGYTCDNRCGKGGVLLYQKVDGGWKLIKTYCDWVS